MQFPRETQSIMIVLIKKKIVDDTMKPEKETKETGPVVQAKWQHS